jgi:HEPN domain-containing protein
MSTGFKDFINLSECDFKACQAMEASFPDEYAIRIVTYHLQQAVEKILKAVILYYGETPAFTHDIARLAEHCVNLGAVLPEEIEDISDTLTLWESKSRYDPYISFSKKKYDIAKNVYEKIHSKLLEEIAKFNQ